MATKPHRGKTLWHLPKRGRGTCPNCGRTGVKLLYPSSVQGKTVNVCKKCREKKAY